MRKLTQKTLFPLSLLITLLASIHALQAGIDPALIPPTVVVTFLLVATLGERLLPRVRQAAEPGELRADLGFAGLTAIVDALAHTSAAAFVVVCAGLLPAGLLAAWPLWAGALGVLLVSGFGDYWAHRFGHQWAWWWKLHAVHHRPHRMVAINNLRLHPVDLALKILFAMVPVFLLGFAPEAIALAAAVKGLNVAFQHADIDLRHGYLNYLFSTNSVHRWHHSARSTEANANYGGVLSVFDLLFGSYKVPAEHLEPKRMGLFQ